MSERSEHPPGPEQSAESKFDREALLAEYGQLEEEWANMAKYRRFKKSLLSEGPLPDDIRDSFEEFERELSLLHTRQREILDRQAAIETQIFRAAANRQ